MLKYFTGGTILPGDEPSTSTSAGTSSPGYGAPEELLASVVGSWNRWRLLVIFVFCVIMLFDGINSFASELLVPIHLAFNCTEGSKITQDPCYTTNGNPCNTFKYSRRYGYTLTEKFNLVCDKQLKIEVSNLLFRCGMALGYIVIGRFADAWGRKKVLFLSLILQPCSGILVTASRSYTFFCFARFFNGFAASGTGLVAVILTCEISSNKWRTFDLGLLCISYAIGHALLPNVWMIFADSMKNILIMSIPQIMLITFIGIIRESPSWLLCKNETMRAESVLLTVAHFNGQRIPSNFRLRPVQITNVSSRRSMRFFRILKPLKTRWVIVGLCLIWFLTTFMGGLLMAHLVEKNKNLLEINLLTGISSIVAAILSLMLCHIMQHKIIIAISSILGAITTSVAYNVIEPREHNENKFLITDLLAYGLYEIALFTVWNMTPRVFPTEMRGEGTGVSIAVGTLSFTFAQLLLPYLYRKLSVFLAAFWCCIVLILMCCYVLFSVHKRELPDVIEDTVNFKDTYKPTRWSTLRATSPTIDETEVKVVDFERGTSLSVDQPKHPFRFGKARKN